MKYKTEPPKTPGVLLPAGDYIFCVREFECGIQSGGKTSGSEKFVMQLEIEGKGATVRETLIAHESTGWKINNFIQCAGIVIPEGGEFEFRRDVAEDAGCTWVNPIGLRGHCAIIVETYAKKTDSDYPNTSPKNMTGKANKVAVFYTDRPKLAPNESLRAESEKVADPEDF
jgi:hypothetical protein